jgi:hypothetical protein
VINDVADATAEMPKDSDLVGNFNLALRLGSDIGKVLRYATNFDVTKLIKRDKPIVSSLFFGGANM